MAALQMIEVDQREAVKTGLPLEALRSLAMQASINSPFSGRQTPALHRARAPWLLSIYGEKKQPRHGLRNRFLPLEPPRRISPPLPIS